ncbi:Fungal Zn2Cys6 Cluster domain [Yamadazyma tenuis]|uniref:Fungal Zn2Cys6 Cluster domain n=1 Tax=Candida tenuis TaxID=2315449 RepID=UPI0027A4DC91|nr:Fungal Zn2Cys6 Cluster domain [Yamadazyma tenuis]
MSDNSPEYSSMKRTRVACETCRRKKIKCSGSNPCSNCQQSKETECVYIEKLRKKSHHDKSISKRSSTFKAVKTLEHKLSRLEGFMMDMSEKLDYMAGLGSGSKSNTLKGGLKDNDNSTDSSESGSSDYEEDEYTDEADLNDQEEDDQKRPDFADTEYGKNGHHQIKTVHETTDKYGIISKLSELSRKGKRNSNRKSYTIYNMRQTFFETHSFFSVCSPRSLQWISRSLAPSKKKVLDQFNKFPYFLYTRSNKFLAKWTDPVLITPENKTRLLERPLPEDRALAFSLLEHCKPQMVFEEYLISPESTRVLFDRYYKKEKMLASELLILCSLMYIFIGASLDEREGNIESDNRVHGPIDRYGPNELEKFLDEVLEASMCLYNRISVIGQGTSTVQAILLHTTAIGAHGLPEADNMLLSVAIRHAKDMGMHRPASYSNLSSDEVRVRKHLWWACQQMDIDFSFRHGKPPILSSDDIMRFSSDIVEFIVEDMGGYRVSDLLPGPINSQKSYETLLEMGPYMIADAYRKNNFEMIWYFQTYVVSRLRSKAYFKLFSPVGDSTTSNSIQNTLEELNSDAFLISDMFVNEFKPAFFDDPGFCPNLDKFTAETKDMIIINHCKFFLHLMLTNRVPFLIKGSTDTYQMSVFRKLHLRSTRTLLHLSLKIREQTDNLMHLNRISFFPFAAFLMLLSNCVNNPFHAETLSDVGLLDQVSTAFFDVKIIKSKRLTNMSIFVISMKLFLRLVVAVIESRTEKALPLSELHYKQFAVLVKCEPQLFSKKRSPGFTIRVETPEVLSSPAKNNPNKTTMNEGDSPSSGNGDHQSKSPSYNPSLANLMHPTDYYNAQDDSALADVVPGVKSFSSSVSSPIMNFDFPDEAIDPLLNSQMNQLPNFFFDNNLGF